MPRVKTKTKSTVVTKSPYRCTSCREEIAPGQQYYQWEKRYGGPQRRHVSCGYPRPSELSGRKTAVLEDAIQDAQAALAAWSVALGDTEPVDVFEIPVDEIESVMEDVASQAEEIADEYEEGANNMPDALRYSPTAEAMEDVAQRLRDWADTVRDWASQVTATIDLPDPMEYEDEDGKVDRDRWANDAEQILEDEVETIRDTADAAFEDMPEYEG